MPTISTKRVFTGVDLTPKGVRAIEKVLSILENVESLSGVAGAGITTSLKVGCLATVASYSLPQTFAALSRTYPNFNIEVTHNFSRNVQHEIQLGKVDLGIVVNPAPAVDLVMKKIAEDIVGVWIPRGVRFDDSRVICDENLVQTQTILRRWKEQPKSMLSIQNLDLMVLMVEQGLGYGIIPARTLGLVTDSLRQFRTQRQLGIVVSK